MVEISSGRWHNQWDDGWNVQRTMTRFMGWQFGKNKVVGCTEFWQANQKHLWCTTRVVSRLACISDWNVASSSVHLSYKNHHPSSHSITFRKHIVRASPSSLSETRLFNSCITQSHPLTPFLGNWFNPFNLFFFFFSFFSFNPSLFLAKFYVFLHPSPFFNPSVLGSVTTCRQCLVR